MGREVSALRAHTFQAPGGSPPHHPRGTEARLTGSSGMKPSMIDGHGADHLRPSKAANGRSRPSLRSTPMARRELEDAGWPAAKPATVVTTAARAASAGVLIECRIGSVCRPSRADAKSGRLSTVENLPHLGQQLVARERLGQEVRGELQLAATGIA